VLPLERRQLQPQRQVLDRDGLMPGTQQSKKTKQKQNDDRHAVRLFSRKVKLLRTDTFLAKDNFLKQVLPSRHEDNVDS
jgi:hypothetical protein